jgi:hypothetical protein
MDGFLLHTKEGIEKEIRWHVEKILITQDGDGMTPWYTEVLSDKITGKKDIPRQAMTTMALMFANELIPNLEINSRIVLSKKYIQENTEFEPSIGKLYIHLFLALSEVYTGKKEKVHLSEVEKNLTPTFLKNPIAVGLYLRLSYLLPERLPHHLYVLEIQRYHLSLTPRPNRFFDYADTLVWAKGCDAILLKNEQERLLRHKTISNWFNDINTGIKSTASVVGKMFEVFSYSPENKILIQDIYRNLMQQRVSSQYAKDAFGKYQGHIISELNTLRIDDVHTHILIGLCYLYQNILKVHE